MLVVVEKEDDSALWGKSLVVDAKRYRWQRRERELINKVDEGGRGRAAQ